jgi:chaperonin GroEL
MPTEIVRSEEMRRKILSGADRLVDAMKGTLGPRGRNAVLERPHLAPLVTNDGATIAKDFALQGRFENMGVQLIKEVAAKTSAAAGDGTTTAMVLARFIIHEGFRSIAAGANPVELKKGVQGAAQLTAAALKRMAAPVETREVIAQVAGIAAGDAQIGGMIAEALDKLGPDGVVTVDEGGADTVLEMKVGMQLERGYVSAAMTTDPEKTVAELAEPYILITDRKLTSPHELVPLLEQVVASGKPLLIVAEAVESQVLGLLAANMKSGLLKAVVIHPPAYGDGRRARMEDLALFTGGTFLSEDLGYRVQDAKLEMLGRAASVRVERNNTVVLGGAGDKAAVADRIAWLRTLIDKAEYEFDRKQLEERLAKLSAGVAVIKVGATTVVEMQEKKQRVEDALRAARSAVAEGIVPGGGAAFITAIPAVRAFANTLSGDMRIGAGIVLRALTEPARQIAENAGMDGSTVVAEILRRPAGTGLDVATGEYVNMFDAGILDSAKVIRLALLNAASLSAILLTTEVAVSDGKA